MTLPKASAGLEWSYRLSLAGKGGLGLLQLVGGFALWLSPGGSALRFADWLTRNELAGDPDDPLSLLLLKAAQLVTTPDAENFYTLYLIGHGVLNFGVVIALLFRIRGAYYASMATLIGFVAYQLWTLTKGFDPMLIVLTGIDVVIIVLVLAERRQTRGQR